MRILVVEDEHKIANAIKKGLEQESYAVGVAYDGEYGYDLASTEDLSLDTLNFQVKRGKKEIQLSKTEFALLEHLLRNKGRILTKDQIIDHVWDYEADILPNTVEVYIGYLRNKIDRSFKSKLSLIQTVRGFGYKIAKD